MTTRPDVILIDAGVGNLRSVNKALQSLGASVLQTADPEALASGEPLVLPGVGAFGDFMRGLQERRLAPAVLSAVRGGVPLLGICVGMQALFECSLEMGRHPGLGLLPGHVLPFPAQPGLKIPHTGWNQLIPRKPEPLLRGIAAGDYAYFNHSYYCEPAGDADAVAAETDYGLRFTSAIQQGNLYAVQFHPEKSQKVGLQVLANFLSLS